ncbi:MAG: hypothetical protein C4563_11525 [Desulfobulbus sp.]|nr:MAG: hypothetical protein C4563_11525 [Desulfobulbus sp.]
MLELLIFILKLDILADRLKPGLIFAKMLVIDPSMHVGSGDARVKKKYRRWDTEIATTYKVYQRHFRLFLRDRQR